MTDSKLDRLSALLEGLAPVVTMRLSQQGRLEGALRPENDSALQLLFLTRGLAELEVGGASERIEAPALVGGRGC
jgi:hypothetical protein